MEPYLRAGVAPELKISIPLKPPPELTAKQEKTPRSQPRASPESLQSPTEENANPLYWEALAMLALIEPTTYKSSEINKSSIEFTQLASGTEAMAVPNLE